MGEAILMDVLYSYTVYEKPRDFPDAWVVRRWGIQSGTGPVDAGLWCVAKSLDMARGSIPAGLACLDRSPEDDPTIIETWI